MDSCLRWNGLGLGSLPPDIAASFFERTRNDEWAETPVPPMF